MLICSGSCSPTARCRADVGVFPDGTPLEVSARRRHQSPSSPSPSARASSGARCGSTGRHRAAGRGVVPQALRRALDATYVRWVPAVDSCWTTRALGPGSTRWRQAVAGATLPGRVTFTLTRASAEVTYPAAVEVTREESWRVVGALDWLGDLTRLSPTDEPRDRAACRTGRRLRPADLPPGRDRNLPGVGDRLLPEPAGRPVEPGLHAARHPAGPLAHTLEISSPKLAEPLTVS